MRICVRSEYNTTRRLTKVDEAGYDIIAAGTTGRLLHDKVGLEVEALLSGPIGGDAQTAARVASRWV